MSTIEKIVLKYFYLGDFKYGPGTITSFVILLVYFFIPNNLSYQLSILLFHLILGFYYCYIYNSKNNKNHDPGFIVIDEVVGMMISLFFIPKLFSAYLLAFIIFRALDIFKPSIIFRVQSMRYGSGIMMDDIIAGILSLLIVTGIFT